MLGQFNARREYCMQHLSPDDMGHSILPCTTRLTMLGFWGAVESEDFSLTICVIVFELNHTV